MNNNTIDLTGDPIVEEQIRQYYVKKKAKEEQNKVIFTEGVANREKERVKFTIDNSNTLKISAEELELYNKNNAKAWDKYYKGDKTRKRYESQQTEDYSN